MVDEGSDTWNLVQRSNAGVCVPSGDPMPCQSDSELKQEPSGCNYGAKWTRLAQAHHSPEHAAQAMETLLECAIVAHGERK